MADEAERLADRCGVAAAAGISVDVNAAMVEYTLRTVGRILFGADVDDAIPVIRATFPVLNEHVRRRGVTPLRLPRRWPTPVQVRAARAQRALRGAIRSRPDFAATHCPRPRDRRPNEQSRGTRPSLDLPAGWA